jgi:hypothetical protein
MIGNILKIKAIKGIVSQEMCVRMVHRHVVQASTYGLNKFSNFCVLSP